MIVWKPASPRVGFIDGAVVVLLRPSPNANDPLAKLPCVWAMGCMEGGGVGGVRGPSSCGGGPGGLRGDAGLGRLASLCAWTSISSSSIGGGGGSMDAAHCYMNNSSFV